MYRQGDVLLVPVSPLSVEEATLQRADGKLILAYGEVTGHHHYLPARLASLIDFNENVYVRIHEETFLRHQEHTPLRLPAGDYKLIHQREYAPGTARPYRPVFD